MAISAPKLDPRGRKVKILATVGPASRSPEMLARLFKAGVDAFRVNMSHGEHADHAQTIETIRALEKKFMRPIAILADLQGPKLRVGKFKDGQAVIRHSGHFTLDRNPEPGDDTRVELPHPELFGLLDGLGDPGRDVGADAQPVENQFYRVVLVAVELDVLVEAPHLAVDACANEALLPEVRELLAVLAFALAHHGRHHQERAAVVAIENRFDDLVDGPRLDDRAALGTRRRAEPGHEQPQVVEDDRLSHRRERAAQLRQLQGEGARDLSDLRNVVGRRSVRTNAA